MEIWSEVIKFLEWLWGFWQVPFLVCHIALNVVVAVSASVYTGEFCLGKTGEFLYRKVVPYIMLFAAFAGLGEAANLGAITGTAFVALEGMLFADLLDNLKKLGLPIPDFLTKPPDFIDLGTLRVSDDPESDNMEMSLRA